MNHKQLRSKRGQRPRSSWPLDSDVLCWLAAIALMLLFFEADRMFVPHLSGIASADILHSIPQPANAPTALTTSARLAVH
ncbi:hypothetical protein [Pseudomonas sp. SCB32]|uniref:hypothetical protein n=1 Tax=Pseudomonas sp. SCB32 TaxID=2653853 RepID=UPI0012641D68|nr:hypothetical protein [Pseudomonas sp. SCB32]